MWNDKKVEISIDAFSNAKIPKKEAYFFVYKKLSFWFSTYQPKFLAVLSN